MKSAQTPGRLPSMMMSLASAAAQLGYGKIILERSLPSGTTSFVTYKIHRDRVQTTTFGSKEPEISFAGYVEGQEDPRRHGR